jgi:hypothetical protein
VVFHKNRAGATATNKPGKLIKVPGGAGLIVITP